MAHLASADCIADVHAQVVYPDALPAVIAVIDVFETGERFAFSHGGDKFSFVSGGARVVFRAEHRLIGGRYASSARELATRCWIEFCSHADTLTEVVTE